MITKQQVIQVVNILPEQFTVEQLYNKLILSERIEEALQESEENLYTVKQVKELMRVKLIKSAYNNLKDIRRYLLLKMYLR